MLLLLLFQLFIIVNYTREMRSNSIENSLEDRISVEENEIDSSGETTLQEQLEYLPFNENFEIDPANLKLLEVLGGGYFGDVRLGLLTSNDTRTLVAVKTTKSALTKRMSRMNESELEQELCRQRESLRDELKIMSFLPEHPNVVKLLGAITTAKNDFCVVIEYCEHGGLDSFLRQKFDAGSFTNELVLDTDNEGYVLNAENILKTLQKRSNYYNYAEQLAARRNSGHITTSDLLSFALQIARAMAFLTGNMVLHRDVALRNVLLKSDFTIRVADFGLSRRAGDDGSYFQSRNIVVPFRYMAPEALRSGRFSKQSELWSFGVVLWELFTFAKQQPYDGADYCNTGAKDVYGILDYLDSGMRLHISKYTPGPVAAIITKLWHEDPSQRPSFKTCQEVLKEELMRFNPMMAMFHTFSGKRESITSIRKADTNVTNGIEEASIKNENRVLRRRLHCTIGLSLLFAVLCVLIPSAIYLLQPKYVSQHSTTIQDYFTASNNEKYQFMLEWNTTTDKLKATNHAIFGEICHTNANNISLVWQPYFAKSTDDPHWIGLHLSYENGVLEQVGVTKIAFEALNTASTLMFHKWTGEEWQRKHQDLGAKYFMPVNFDEAKFADGIVIFRIYWTTESRAELRSQLDDEVMAILAESDSPLACCPDQWTPLPNSHKCIKVEEEKKAWLAANRTCMDHGGYLLSIGNETDAEFVVSLARIYLPDDENSIWIGGRTNNPKANETNDWYWTDRSNSEVHMWNDGEPNNANRLCHTEEQESCLEFVLWNGKWSSSCCTSQFSFVCELIFRNLAPCK